jgi:hypothetical protein
LLPIFAALDFLISIRAQQQTNKSALAHREAFRIASHATKRSGRAGHQSSSAHYFPARKGFVHIAHLRAGLLATAPRMSILFNTATPFFVIKTRTTHWCSLLLRRKSTVPPSTESRAAINKLIFENRVPLIPKAWTGLEAGQQLDPKCSGL